MDNNMVSFLKRAAEQSGFLREFYIEKNIPTLSDNICVLPFFGDLRSTCILSTFLLKPFKEWFGKYLILCSWPGYQHLFPYVDEFWSIKDLPIVENLAIYANNFYNSSETDTNYTRNLVRHFEHVLSYDNDLKPFYHNGFESKYFEKFQEIRRFLPEVSSLTQMTESMQKQISNSNKKILLYPVKQIRSWQKGEIDYLLSPKDFWIELTNQIIDLGFQPVVYQNYATFDLSPEFTNKCIYLTSQNLSHIIAAMNQVGLVLDVYSGISRLAIAARTPFICVDERLRYINQKDYELDDLSCETNRKYAFSFATMLLSGGIKEWTQDILRQTTNLIKEFPLKDLNKSTKESYESIEYSKVRQWNAKRLGVKFIHKY